VIFVACTTFGHSWSLAIDTRSSRTRSWPWLAWSSSDQSFSLNHQLCRFSALQVFCFLILIQDCVPHMFSGTTIKKHYWSMLSSPARKVTLLPVAFGSKRIGCWVHLSRWTSLKFLCWFSCAYFCKGVWVSRLICRRYPELCRNIFCSNKMVIMGPVDCYEDFEINGVSCVGIKAPLVSMILWGHTSSANPRICWLYACPIVQDCHKLMKSIGDSWQLISV
jgi:hypothetical protein